MLPLNQFVLKALLVIGAYLLGSVPFAVILTGAAKGVDLREHGSGHAGATNAMRTAGWKVGLLVMVLDLAKAWLPLRVGFGLAVLPIWLALVGAASVAGHCWPVWARFRGGRGVAAAGGALLATWPLGFVLGVGLAAFFTLSVRHAARALVVTGLLIAPVWVLFGAPSRALGVPVAVGGLVALRALSDWNRQYSELWLDRPSRSDSAAADSPRE